MKPVTHEEKQLLIKALQAYRSLQVDLTDIRPEGGNTLVAIMRQIVGVHAVKEVANIDNLLEKFK